MQKFKTLFVLSVLAFSALSAGAWRHVWDASQVSAGDVIALQAIDVDENNNVYFFNGAAQKSTELSYANLYQLESASEGYFYLKRLSDGKYVVGGTTSGTAITMSDSKETNAEWQIINGVIPSDGMGWNTGALGNYRTFVRVQQKADATLYLNTQAATTNPTVASGVKVWSAWGVRIFDTTDYDTTAGTLTPTYNPYPSSRLYHIRNARGYLYASSETKCGSTASISTDDTEANAYLWAIVPSEDGSNIYLYNPAKKAYVVCNASNSDSDGKWDLTSLPTTSKMHLRNTMSTEYPFHISDNDNWLNFNTDQTTGLTVYNDNYTSAEGTIVAIEQDTESQWQAAGKATALAEMLSYDAFDFTPVASLDKIQNGKVYYIRGFKSQATSNGDVLLCGPSTAEDVVTTTSFPAYTGKPNFAATTGTQWMIYHDADNDYYVLYNIDTNTYLTNSSTTSNAKDWKGTQTAVHVFHTLTQKGSEDTTAPRTFTIQNKNAVGEYGFMHCNGGGIILNWKGESGNGASWWDLYEAGDANASVVAAMTEKVKTDVTAAIHEQYPALAVGSDYGDLSSADEVAAYNAKLDLSTYTTATALYKRLGTIATDLAAVSVTTRRVPKPGEFLRVKSYDGNWYLSEMAPDAGLVAATSVGKNDAGTIFYWEPYTYNNSNNTYLLRYADGKYPTQTSGPTNSTEFAADAHTHNYAMPECTSVGYEKYFLVGTRGRHWYWKNATAATPKVDGGGAQATTTTNTGYMWQLEAVTTLPVTVSAHKWATYYSPVALTMPEGLTAYTVSQKNENGYTLQLTEITDGTIPGGTPVLLYADVEAATTFLLTVADGATHTDPVADANTYMTGALSALTLEDGAYVLSVGTVTKDEETQTGVVAFYPKRDGEVLKGFKAYLTADQAAANAGGEEVRAAAWTWTTEETVTAIEAARDASLQTGHIYNLNGQRVEKAAHGIFIINGKKVVVR